MSQAGVFIVLEGLDGCGKSTQAVRLSERLRGMGRTVVHTREPGGTALGERLRDVLLDNSLGEIAPMAEVFLYQASRTQLVEAVIRPALEAGQVVVCERWHYATSAYQGAYEGVGRRADPQALETSSKLAVGGTEPDRAILLDVPEAESGLRLGRLLDRVESRGDAYRARVGDAFRKLFSEQGGRHVIVSGRGSIEDVETRVWEAVRDLCA